MRDTPGAPLGGTAPDREIRAINRWLRRCHGLALRALRLRVGLTQPQVAEALGCHRQDRLCPIECALSALESTILWAEPLSQTNKETP